MTSTTWSQLSERLERHWSLQNMCNHTNGWFGISLRQQWHIWTEISTFFNSYRIIFFQFSTTMCVRKVGCVSTHNTKIVFLFLLWVFSVPSGFCWGKHQRHAKQFEQKCGTTDTIWLAVIDCVVFSPSPLKTYSLMIKQLNVFSERPCIVH